MSPGGWLNADFDSRGLISSSCPRFFCSHKLSRLADTTLDTLESELVSRSNSKCLLTASGGWYTTIVSSFLFQCPQLSPSQIPGDPDTEFWSIYKITSMENEESLLLWPRDVTYPSLDPVTWWAACHPLGSSSVSEVSLGEWSRVSFQLFLLDIFLYQSLLATSFLLNYSLFSVLTEFTLLTHLYHIGPSFLLPILFPYIWETSCCWPSLCKSLMLCTFTWQFFH